MDNIDDYLWELRGLAGYDFSLSETSTIITPYIGVGYRYLNDDMSGMTTTTGDAGYERESNYFYSPIGIEVTVNSENGWSIGGAFEYDHFWWGKQKSNMGSVPGYYNIENDQEKGYGLRGSIKLKKKNEIIDFKIEPFIRYWNIEDSEITADPEGRLWIEPENHSIEYGLSFKFSYSWPDSRVRYYKDETSYWRTRYPRAYSRRYQPQPEPRRKTVTYDKPADYYNVIREQILDYARRMRISATGNVYIDFTITSDGRVKEVYTYSDNPELQDFAREVVINAAPF